MKSAMNPGIPGRNLYGVPSILLVLTGIMIFAAGCTSQVPGENVTPAIAPGTEGTSSYEVTLRQPEATSSYIHMDTDVYNIGEVVEFMVTNDGSGSLDCASDPPAFSVKFQGINGAWGTRLGKDAPDTTKKSTLAPGVSTATYRFVTDGWEPGRYRIVQDCGLVREFILKPNPTLPPTPAATADLVVTGIVTPAPPAPDNATKGSPAATPENVTASPPFNTTAFPVTSTGRS